ncbi:MAG TPA: lipase family protein [Patescibacteria group bacterium]|nr:lipase family protein [Patescibacteria group bacterium]
MKKVVFVICSVFLLLLAGRSGTAWAGPLEDCDEAYHIYLFSAVSRGAYSDPMAKVVLRELRRDGWRVNTYVNSTTEAETKFLVAKKDVPGKRPLYMVGIAGTESKKDRKIDLSFGKVYFAGNTVAEHTANAQLDEKTAPPGSPLVHRGFLRYVQTMLTVQDPDTQGKPLLEELLKNPDQTVYLVGHSLGGAAATLSGAYLLDLGVRPEQIKVWTFGAPPVGNEAFAQKYADRLNLTRIVIHGDPISSVLQNFVGGYRLFGKEITWYLDEDYVKIHHSLALYMDYAMKQYYQKRRLAQEAKLLELPDIKKADAGQPMLYVTPLENALPEELNDEFLNMKDVLTDEYRGLFSGYIMNQGSVIRGEGDSPEYLQRAADAGCQVLIIPVITATQMREERNTYYITLYQRVYRVADRTLLSAATLSSNTRNMTPLTALAHGAVDMTAGSVEWLPLIGLPATENKK